MPTTHTIAGQRRTAPTWRTAFALLLLCLGSVALAAYPERPIRLIIPFPPGGSADFMARGMAQRLAAELGQAVVLENRGGAGGTLAAEAAATARPDGYTLIFATMGTLAINPALYPKLRYDPVKDFTPVALTHITPRVLVVHASVAARSVVELLALARTRPGKLTYGSAGSGSSSHLSGALFASMAGIELLHVPYKGSAPLLTDLMAGRIDLTFDSFSVYEEQIKAGRLRALGVTSKHRLAALPDVPPISEAGVPGFEVSNWLGVLAPSGTPKEIIATLHAALARAMAAPSLRQQLAAVGIEPLIGSPDEFAALLRSELVKWAQIVKRSGATAD